MRLRPLLLPPIALAGLTLALAEEPPPPKADPRQELQATCQQLQSLARGLEECASLEGALVEITRLAARLDVFELRFGARPHQVDGWDAVRAEARALLPRMGRLTQEGPYFNADSARVAYAVLLALDDQQERALALLRSIEPGGGCGNWKNTVRQAILRRESGLLQWRGDYEGALQAQRKALGKRNTLHSPDPDLLLARLAFLSERCGSEEDAVLSYQRVVDLHPGTVGSDLSWRP